MKISKKERQKLILSIVQHQNISTQEALVDSLRSMNFSVTQSTISRDIKELGLTKSNGSSLGLKYVFEENTDSIHSNRLITVFVQALISYETAANLVIVKTLPGMAPACASAIDSLHFDEVSGSIAGDDTIFIATKSAIVANRLSDRIQDLLKKYLP
jgi:transcriptional regulator of arginine metabolism